MNRTEGVRSRGDPRIPKNRFGSEVSCLNSDYCAVLLILYGTTSIVRPPGHFYLLLLLPLLSLHVVYSESFLLPPPPPSSFLDNVRFFSVGVSFSRSCIFSLVLVYLRSPCVLSVHLTGTVNLSLWTRHDQNDNPQRPRCTPSARGPRGIDGQGW